MVVEVWFPPLGPSDGREKNQAKKILNDKTHVLSTSKKIGGGVLIYRYDIILNFYLDS